MIRKLSVGPFPNHGVKKKKSAKMNKIQNVTSILLNHPAS